MGLFFLGDQRQDFITMVEEITQRVENLRLGDAQRLGDIQDRFALPMQRHDVANGHTQAIDYRLAAADAFEANDMRMFGLHSLWHAHSSSFFHQCSRQPPTGLDRSLAVSRCQKSPIPATIQQTVGEDFSCAWASGTIRTGWRKSGRSFWAECASSIAMAWPATAMPM